MQINTNKFVQGSGIWKFNNSLLNNQDYLNLINKVITEEKLKYALPVYNLDYIRDNNVTFSVDDDIFLETLFLRIRGETVKFSKFLKKKEKVLESNLKNDIAWLESNVNESNMKLLDDKKAELESIRKEKIKGYITRARIQWLDQGEKPTSFFCKLESKQFTEKTIRKLQLDNGFIINDQKMILKEVQKYYTNLFKEKETFSDFNLAKNITGNKVNQKNDIGKNISVMELGAVLKKMKNNKSPGIDGLSSEFFKVFWGKLKHFTANAINSCFFKGCLSISMRQTVITCLPKGQKDRNLLKNWRPISLLSVVYKLASATIAERLKSTLPHIISSHQSGFLSGRSIADSTRLVYDLMSHTEKNKIPGLLMLIDFEKAFDSVSWSFLYKVLDFFGFDNDFINWIKLFNNNVIAYVIQCGFLSDPIPVKRGCRQGDPIAPYLFLLVAEILSRIIENSSSIKGITIGKHNYKLTQFADDTTIFLDGSTKSLQATLNVLETFGSISGLKMNTEKTKLIWIGSKKHCKEKLNVSSKLHWGDSDFNLLGIDFSIELTQMPELNYEKAILRAKQTLNSWQHRYLTPIGKITVIKTLILSKFTHLFLSVSTPPHLINTLNKLLFSYIWDGKPDKINRQQICKKISDGGLAMIHVYNFERSLKIRWVKHIISGRNCAWLTLLNHEIKDLNKLALLGGDWLNHRISNLNPFWKTVFSYFMELCRKVKVHSRQDIVSSSLWFNTHIGTDNLFFPDWFKHGIYSIGDIIHTNGNTLSLPEMKNRYNFSINFLNYFTVKKVLQNFITLYQQSNTFGFQRPFIPFHIKDLLLPGRGHKSVYFQLQQKINKPRKNELKWCLELDIVQDNDFWKQVYKICFCAINDNEYIWFQYRVLYRILGVNELLVKMENAENDTCRLCHCHVESLTHLFSECTVTNALWNNVVSWIETKISIKLHLDKISKTLGYLEQDNFFWPLNFFLTITRYYIFTCAYKHQDPNIYCLQNTMKQKFFLSYIVHKHIWQPGSG